MPDIKKQSAGTIIALALTRTFDDWEGKDIYKFLSDNLSEQDFIDFCKQYSSTAISQAHYGKPVFILDTKGGNELGKEYL